jgi:two-component system chemotaxis sensor kinase CheA
MDIETYYLGWNIKLTSGINEIDIHEVFEWVVDESDLIIAQGVAVVSESAAVTEVEADIEIVAEPAVVQPTNVAAIEPVLETAASATPEPIETAVAAKKASSESVSIQVGIDKVDSLINRDSELVITQSMLGKFGSEFEMDSLPNLIEGLGQLEQNTLRFNV